MKKLQVVLAAFVVLLSGILGGAVAYLAFVVPKALALWEQQNMALSAPQKLVANASVFCTSHGLLLLAVLALVFLASLVWMAAALRKSRTDKKPQTLELPLDQKPSAH